MLHASNVSLYSTIMPHTQPAGQASSASASACPNPNVTIAHNLFSTDATNASGITSLAVP